MYFLLYFKGNTKIKRNANMGQNGERNNIFHTSYQRSHYFPFPFFDFKHK